MLVSNLKMEVNVPPKRRLTFNGLHGVTSQKTELFITLFVLMLSSYDLEAATAQSI
jgi:hypothetical protein